MSVFLTQNERIILADPSSGMAALVTGVSQVGEAELATIAGALPSTVQHGFDFFHSEFEFVVNIYIYVQLLKNPACLLLANLNHQAQLAQLMHQTSLLWQQIRREQHLRR
jgi:hypothetical protein